MSLIPWSTGAISIDCTQPTVLSEMGIEIQLEMATDNKFSINGITSQTQSQLLVDEEFSMRLQTPDCGMALFTLCFNNFQFPCNIVKSRHNALRHELIQSSCVGRSARKDYLESIIGFAL